jgi:hypothetical protein
MDQDHPSFRRPPDDNVKIWRYMSLLKFVWMLQKQALYFSRSDLMGDPFEGHYSRSNAMGEDDFVKLQMTDPALAEIPEAAHRKNYQLMLKTVPNTKVKLFVNCWHMNENESLAMWKLYAATDDSICIQSTYACLCSQMHTHALVGMVNYIDYEKDHIEVGNLFNYITHKRRSFEHERELRAVLWLPNIKGKLEMAAEDRGLVAPVDLNQLIERVFINPNADPLLQEVVAGLKTTYGLKARIHIVNRPPEY